MQLPGFEEADHQTQLPSSGSSEIHHEILHMKDALMRLAIKVVNRTSYKINM